MRYIFIFFIYVSSLVGAVQLEVANKKWQLIGVNGVYNDGVIPPVFGTSGIIAFDTVDVDGDVSYYSAQNNVLSITPNDQTVGLLAIQGAFSPSGDTQLNVGVSVFFEISTFLTYDRGQTRYRMYLAGRNEIPAIRVDFQANLIGKSFKVRFANENIYYTAYFNPDNTFDAPQLLSENSLGINTVTTTSNIIDVFDVNLSDNNLSDIARNNATPYINAITPLTDINVTLYTLTPQGVWSLWDSRNSVSGTNGFNAIESGRGYWILANNNMSAPVHHGLILGDQGINDNTHNNIYNGWNLVSFRDSNIRYSPSGLFIPLTEFSPARGGVSISYRSSIDEINITSNVGTNIVRRLNWGMQNLRQTSSSSTKFIAYPAREILANFGGASGVVIISDDKLDVNVSSAHNLSGRALKTSLYDGYTRYSSVFGDYLVGFELNSLIGVDINQTINISMPAYNPNIVTTSDLNVSALNIAIFSIFNSFEQSAVSSNTNVANADTAVYLINTDLSAVNLNLETVLLSSTGRFSVQDGNFIKKFRLLSDGASVVVGSQNRKLSSISQINSFSNDTNVRYIDLFNNEFMIVSNKASNLDLLENSGYTMFLDEPDITSAASRSIARGAIGRVYTHLSLLSPTISYNVAENLVENITYSAANDGYLTNISSYTNDLVGPPMVALDFPSDGPLNDLALYGKTISQIVTATTVVDEPNVQQSLVWAITDLTKSPKDWFNINDTQDVFVLKKEKGYWINVRDFTSIKLSVDTSSSLSLSTVVHFDNNITVNANDKIGLVTNHINHLLSLKIIGLNPLESTAYDVSAIIRGRKFPMIANGIRFDLQVNDINMGLEESVEGATLDDAIKIQIYDGLGNSLTNVDYSVHFIKPAKPSTKWGDDGELIVDFGNNEYEIHNKPILDTSPRDSVIIENSSAIYSSDKINWKSVDGNVSLLRVIAKKEGVYSDMSITPFVPFKDAHVLQVRNNHEVDKIPYSFISNSILKKNNIEIDNGVQITNLRDNVILMSYRPDTQGLEELPAFGGTTSMYLKVGTTIIGYITYIKSYANKPFYIYYGSSLYQGYFSNNDSFAIANSAYDLTSGTLDFSNLSLLGSEGNEIDFNGFSGSIQPIYEPDPISINSNNINIPSGQQPPTGGVNPPQPILPTI